MAKKKSTPQPRSSPTRAVAEVIRFHQQLQDSGAPATPTELYRSLPIGLRDHLDQLQIQARAIHSVAKLLHESDEAPEEAAALGLLRDLALKLWIALESDQIAEQMRQD